MRAACVCCVGLSLALGGCASHGDQAELSGQGNAPALEPSPAMLGADAPAIEAGGSQANPSVVTWWRPMVQRASALGETLAGMTPGDGFAPELDDPPTGMAAWAWQSLASSHGDRPIRAAQVTANTPAVKRVYIIASIHGSEPEGRRGLDLIAAELEAIARTSNIALRVVEDANPDGSARRQRGNARGIDLNRNWPAQNFAPGGAGGTSPLSEPETQAIAADIDNFDPDLMIVLHSIASGPFVNYDGPAAAHAGAFADGALRSDQRWRLVPNMGYPTPGSLGSYLGQDRGIGILTIEFKRGQAPRSVANALRLGLPEVFAAISSPR